MKNKIALLGGAKRRRQMESVLSECFKAYDIPFEIHHVPNSKKFIHEVLFNNDFRLIMENSKETITYMLKIYTNFDQQYSRHAAGTLQYPLTKSEFIKNMLKAFKLSGVCPYGVYAAKNGKMSRLIPHEDIQFIHKEKNKYDYKFLLLKSGDIIPISKPGFKQLVKAISLSFLWVDAFDY